MMFLVWQSTLILMSILKFVWVDLNICPVVTNGHIGQLLHFFIPGMFLFGLVGGESGTLALMSLSLISGGLLYATKGGKGNT